MVRPSLRNKGFARATASPMAPQIETFVKISPPGRQEGGVCTRARLVCVFIITWVTRNNVAWWRVRMCGIEVCQGRPQAPTVQQCEAFAHIWLLEERTVVRPGASERAK